MSPVDSTATLLAEQTAPPVNGIDLPTVVSGNPAPKHDGKNLFIEIDIHPNEAVFHCQDREHVGNHNQRHVLFCANKHCWLIFKNPSLFTEPYLELMKGEEKLAHILDLTNEVVTDCGIRVGAGKPAKMLKMMATLPAAKRPPVIVVP